MLQNLLVGCITQRDTPEIVLVHELVEEVGTEHHGLGNLHVGVLKPVQFRMALDDVVEKCQATALTTQRTIADACEVCKAVELQAVEDGDDTDVLHATILHDGIEDNLAVSVEVLQFVPRDRFQELRHGEDGACTEPATHVVT